MADQKGSSKRKKESVPLPESLENQRTRVQIASDTPKNTTVLESCRVFSHLGFDNSFDLEEFRENLQIEIIELTDEEMVFDMVGVDAAIANALRRILIAEVPSVAIEKVYISDNTSVVQDEVLAHRLGLIPIRADPKLMDFPDTSKDSDGQMTAEQTIELKLNIACSRVPGSKESDPETSKYVNSRVYSRHLVPTTQQKIMVGGKEVLYGAPVHDDILFARLRPGQALDVTCYCVKGIGKDHAKFSPVSTASYRLLPEILFKEDVLGNNAEILKKKCPMEVFDIEDIGKNQKRAYVKNPRKCTMCRECIRDPEWAKKITLQRVKNHFIFQIESSGALKPWEIFEEAIEVLIRKIEGVRVDLQKRKGTPSEEPDQMEDEE